MRRRIVPRPPADCTRAPSLSPAAPKNSIRPGQKGAHREAQTCGKQAAIVVTVCDSHRDTGRPRQMQRIAAVRNVDVAQVVRTVLRDQAPERTPVIPQVQWATRPEQSSPEGFDLVMEGEAGGRVNEKIELEA